MLSGRAWKRVNPPTTSVAWYPDNPADRAAPTVRVEIDRDVVGITGFVGHRRRMFEGVAVTNAPGHSREVLG